MVATDAKTQRKNALIRGCRYGLNAAGKWVRSSAFRKIDYDPENADKLREFDNFEAAFAFDEECRLNGTGGQKAAHKPKPKDTVPKEQLALEKAMKAEKTKKPAAKSKKKAQEEAKTKAEEEAKKKEDEEAPEPMADRDEYGQTKCTCKFDAREPVAPYDPLHKIVMPGPPAMKGKGPAKEPKRLQWKAELHDAVKIANFRMTLPQPADVYGPSLLGYTVYCDGCHERFPLAGGQELSFGFMNAHTWKCTECQKDCQAYNVLDEAYRMKKKKNKENKDLRKENKELKQKLAIAKAAIGEKNRQLKTMKEGWKRRSRRHSS